MKLHLPAILLHFLLGALSLGLTNQAWAFGYFEDSSLAVFTDTTLAHYAHVTISGGAYGVAITATGTLNLAENGPVSITHHAGDGVASEGTLFLSGNSSLDVTDNQGSGIAGGYVSICRDGDVSISGNGGHGIVVSTLDMSGNGTIRLSDNHSGNGLKVSAGACTIEGNGDIFISGNSYSGSDWYMGNGIYNGGARLSFLNNESLTLSGNSGDCGHSGNGIYNWTNTITISGNKKVTLSNNLGCSGKDVFGSGNGILNFDRGSTMFITDNGDIDIIGNTGMGNCSGNGIQNRYGTMTINHNGKITIEGNGYQGNGGDANGRGINNNEGKLTMNSNGDITIANNRSKGIHNYGYDCSIRLEMNDNGNITVDGNGNSGIENYAGRGDLSTLVMNGNQSISVTNNASHGIVNVATNNGSCLLEMNANGSINISNNGGHGIWLYESNSRMTMQGNQSIIISGNKGLNGSCGIRIGSKNSYLTLADNSYVKIANNAAAGIYNTSGTLEAQGNGALFIQGNVSNNKGGGLYNTGVVNLQGNQLLSLSENTCDGSQSRYSALGGGFYNESATFSMEGNATIEISRNTAFSSPYEGSGGGFYNLGSMTINGNGNIFIEDNTSGSNSGAVFGGGICNSSNLQLISNGQISISGNAVSSNSTWTYAYARGGGIFNSGTLLMSGNEGIILSSNTVTRSKSDCYGGGICSWGSVTLQYNGSVRIVGNTVVSTQNAAYGGGIFSSNGNVTLTNNQSVVFQGNLQSSSTQSILNGIYVECPNASRIVTLAAPESGSMDFYDPIVVKMRQATTDTLLHLNGVLDESGNYAATDGTIRLTGENTEADLSAAYERAGLDTPITQSAIIASRTSNTNGHTALHGGELQIVHQAILETNGLTAEGAGHATLRLENGTLRSTAAITVESGSTLALAGVNTLTATTLDVQDGAALEFSLGSANTTDAALALNATLNTGTLDLHLIGADELSTGTYKLITLADASQYSTDSWTSDLVSVTGGSWERLIWQEGTLYYSTESIEVTDNETESITTGLVPLPIVIREGVALFQQEGADSLIMSYDSTTTDAERLAAIENSTSFARINVGAPEGSVNVLEVAGGQTAFTAALNGAGDLAKTGSGTLEITGAGDHSGTLTVQQGSVSLTRDGQLSSGTLILGSPAATYTLRRAAARNSDLPSISTESGITLAQRDANQQAVIDGLEPLTAQGTVIVGQGGQRAAADNVCISLENSRATFTLGNLDLNNTVVDVNAAAGLILHDLRLDATSQVSNRTDVLAQMTGQNSVQLGSLVSIIGNGQLSTEQLYGVELASTGSLTMSLDSDLLAAAGLTEGGVAELWLAGLQVADTATLTFEDVLQADALKLAITIQAIECEADGTRLHLAVASVPEPATATLTLLALTALAARRRRGLRPVSALRPAC